MIEEYIDVISDVVNNKEEVADIIDKLEDYLFINDTQVFRESKLLENQKLEIFKYVVETFEHAQKYRPHIKGVKSIDKDAYSYCCKNIIKLPKEYRYLFDKLFADFGKSDFQEPLNFDEDIAAFIEKLRKIGFSINKKNQILYDLSETKKFSSTDFASKYKNNSVENFEIIKKAIDDIPKSKLKNIFTDALNYNLWKKENDISLINKIVYHIFLHVINNELPTYIFVNSVSVIDRIIKGSVLNNRKIVFVISDNYIERIYESEYFGTMFEFCYITEVSKLINAEKEKINIIALFDYLSQSKEYTISEKNNERIFEIINLINSKLQRCLVYGPEKKIVSSNVIDYIKNEISNIYLFPQRLKGSTASQKILITTDSNVNRNANVYSYVTKGYSQIEVLSYCPSIEHSKLQLENIRNVYSRENESYFKITNNKRKPPVKRHISKELVMLETISKKGKYFGLESYVEILAEDKDYIKENPKARRYAFTRMSTSKNSEDKIERWFSSIIYVASYSDELYNRFHRVLRNEPMSLTTFSYLNPAVRKMILDNKSFDRLNEIILKYFSDINMDDIDYESIEKRLDDPVFNATEMEKCSILNMLNKIFNEAISENHAYINPLRKEMSRINDATASQIKSVISKKEYTLSENIKLYQESKKLLKQNRNLYYAIRFDQLCGLEPIFYLAIQKSDIKYNEKYGFCEIEIKHKINPKDNTIEDYKGPTIILPEEFGKQVYGLSLSEGSNCLLSDDDGNPLKYHQATKKIKRYVKEVLPQSQLIFETKDKNGRNIKFDALENKGGRTFVSNYKYFALYLGSLESEICNNLMLQQTDTYAKHYLDFSNAFVKLRLFEKNNRIEKLFSGENKRHVIDYDLKEENVIDEIIESYDCQIKTNTESQDSKLIISSKHGFDISIIKGRKK